MLTWPEGSGVFSSWICAAKTRWFHGVCQEKWRFWMIWDDSCWTEGIWVFKTFPGSGQPDCWMWVAQFHDYFGTTVSKRRCVTKSSSKLYNKVQWLMHVTEVYMQKNLPNTSKYRLHAAGCRSCTHRVQGTSNPLTLSRTQRLGHCNLIHLSLTLLPAPPRDPDFWCGNFEFAHDIVGSFSVWELDYC